jgi:enterochelin esterase-like enzyme
MRLNGQIITLQHESQVLAGNPLGDPVARDVIIYLPPGYEDQTMRFPVVWYLPAFTGWGEKVFNVQAWDENLPQRVDRLISEGKMPPVVMAFPDCFTRFGGSQYVNSSAVGRYEDYMVQELVSFVDEEFRTIVDRDHRAVIGYSSGGFGAIWLSMRHPDIFGAVASHSGDMGFEYCYWPDIAGTVRMLGSMGGLEGYLRSFGQNAKTKDWYSTLNIVGMSACYSPNAEAPGGFDLLCDSATGAIREEVWARWKEFDPVRASSSYSEAFQSLRTLYFDCGIRDEFNMFLGARMLHQQLERADIAHTYDEFDGGHQGINWRYDISLPVIVHAIAP